MAPKAGDLPALLAESLPGLSVTARTPLTPITPLTAGGSASNPPAAAGGTAPATTAGRTSLAGSKASGGSAAPTGGTTATPTKKSRGCAVASGQAGSPFALAGFGLALAWFARRRARSEGG